MSQGVFFCFIYIIVTFVVFNIIPLCRSASLYCCARFLVPPIWSTCLGSANLYWCALTETTIVSSSYVSQQFCIGVPLLRLQSYHHQYSSVTMSIFCAPCEIRKGAQPSCMLTGT